MKKPLDQEINEFLDLWDAKSIIALLRNLIPLFELYDVEDESDWVETAVDYWDKRTVRLVRTVYLISRLSEFHAGKMCVTNSRFKDLYKKMEKVAMDHSESLVSTESKEETINIS